MIYISGRILSFTIAPAINVCRSYTPNLSPKALKMSEINRAFVIVLSKLFTMLPARFTSLPSFAPIFGHKAQPAFHFYWKHNDQKTLTTLYPDHVSVIYT